MISNINKAQKLDRLPYAKGFRVVSFFAGAGGLDIGFERAGFDIVHATDIDPMCCETLEANRRQVMSRGMQVAQGDIREIDVKSLPTNIDLVIGGPPCQTFSASGRRAGGAPGRLDERGTLFEAYCRHISVIKPKAFLFENVRGILGTNGGRDWKAIVEAFQKIGYRVSYRILDALDYGAPQQRERLFMVGHRLDRDFLFPEPVYGADSPGHKPHITAGEALEELEDDEDKEPLFLRNGKYAHLLPLVPPGGNYLHFTAKRGYPDPIFAYRSRFSDFLYKANPDAPIKTLIARPGKYTGPFHWDNRRFTVKEYMRLQGFPDGYVVKGGREDAIRQIGNSVSPKVAYFLALAIAGQIFDKKADVRLLPNDKVLTFDKRKGMKAQKTRALHVQVVEKGRNQETSGFRFENYESVTTPADTEPGRPNTKVEVNGNTVRITVRADSSRKLFAKMRIEIRQRQMPFFLEERAADACLEIAAYGIVPHTVQAMWNAVDDWVIRSSNFHSLFELYGHFTEPHPIFKITKFKACSDHPIAKFAQHAANFDNCSRHLPRRHLTELFGVGFSATNFVALVKTLRSYRYDLRCQETNATMPEDAYMVSYPFTLPFGKQMNFSIRPQRLREKSVHADGKEAVRA